jgi:hypothetical protein
MVDVITRLSNGRRYRERRRVSMRSAAAAHRWGEDRDRHLLQLLGSKRLDAIGNEQVQRLKHSLQHRSPKTVNNMLTVLNVLLKKAVEWNVLDRMPCTIRLLPIPKPSAGFYDFDDYERLVEAARPCAGRRPGRFKNWPGIRTWRRRSGTCISVPRRSKARSGCWTERKSRPHRGNMVATGSQESANVNR